MGLVTKVWSYNLYQELAILESRLFSSPVTIAIDIEFPDFLRSTSKDATEQLYEDLKFNVNHLKILQLGLTLIEESTRKVDMTWEFTFSDFNEEVDFSSSPSIYFLKTKGFDFKKQREVGISSTEFRHTFLPICCSKQIVKWVTFHGVYDVAYMLKLMVIRVMPESKVEFAIIAQHLFGTVSDLKHMVRYCDHLMKGELGLKRLAKLLTVDDIIIDSGYDSLLIASAYVKMKKTFKFSSKDFNRFLYGLDYRIKGYKVFRCLVPSLPIIGMSCSPFGSRIHL